MGAKPASEHERKHVLHLGFPSPNTGKKQCLPAWRMAASLVRRCPPDLSCSTALYFVMSQLDLSKSNRRRKTEVREACTELWLLLFEIQGSDIFVSGLLSGCHWRGLTLCECSLSVSTLACTEGPCTQQSLQGEVHSWALSEPANPLQGLSLPSLVLLCPLSGFTKILDLLGFHSWLFLLIVPCSVLCICAACCLSTMQSLRSQPSCLPRVVNTLWFWVAFLRNCAFRDSGREINNARMLPGRRTRTDPAACIWRGNDPYSVILFGQGLLVSALSLLCSRAKSLQMATSQFLMSCFAWPPKVLSPLVIDKAVGCFIFKQQSSVRNNYQFDGANGHQNKENYTVSLSFFHKGNHLHLTVVPSVVISLNMLVTISHTTGWTKNAEGILCSLSLLWPRKHFL